MDVVDSGSSQPKVRTQRLGLGPTCGTPTGKPKGSQGSAVSFVLVLVLLDVACGAQVFSPTKSRYQFCMVAEPFRLRDQCIAFCLIVSSFVF